MALSYKNCIFCKNAIKVFQIQNGLAALKMLQMDYFLAQMCRMVPSMMPFMNQAKFLSRELILALTAFFPYQ